MNVTNCPKCKRVTQPRSSVELCWHCQSGNRISTAKVHNSYLKEWQEKVERARQAITGQRKVYD